MNVPPRRGRRQGSRFVPRPVRRPDEAPASFGVRVVAWYYGQRLTAAAFADVDAPGAAELAAIAAAGASLQVVGQGLGLCDGRGHWHLGS